METTTENSIQESEGYKKLHAAIMKDSDGGWREEDRMAKLTWAVDRARHYEDKTGVDAGDILTAWEDQRNYWYMNYYQDANQPLIKDGSLRVFNTTRDMMKSIGKPEFRCPSCNGISSSPYACDSGIVDNGSVCDWKVYGLFRDLGRGVTVFVKGVMLIERIFMPVAWEESTA